MSNATDIRKSSRAAALPRGLADDLLIRWLEYVDNFVGGPRRLTPWPRRRSPKAAVAALMRAREARKGDREQLTPEEQAAFRQYERVLWGETKVPSTKKVRFGFQDFVRRYRLDRVETRLMTFLCYEALTYLWIGDHRNSRSDFDILSVFCFEGTSGLRNYRLIGPDSKLQQAGLIRLRGVVRPWVGISPEGFGALMGISPDKVNIPGLDIGGDESALFHTFEPRVALDDVVVPAATRETLADALFYAQNRERILAQSGRRAGMEKGTGLVILFWGPPGTGKSMAAEALAGELGSRANVVRPEILEDKFVGETEKKIATLFAAAEEQRAVLIFDECDSYFSSRPRGDYYLNTMMSRQINMMLRGLEEGTGIYILTTNREDALDPALERRLAVKIHFDFPDEGARLELWRRHLPRNSNLAPKDLRLLAARYRVAGGTIKQAVLAAERRAARNGRAIAIKDVEEALAASQIKHTKVGF